MVTLLVVDVLLSAFVPLHDATRHPDAGDAANVIDAPATYRPDAHPVELPGVATGSPPEPVWVNISV